MSNKDQRPWGYYEILSDKPDHKVKRICVECGKRLSYQYHKKRKEHWFVVSGDALVTLDDKQINLKPGDYIDIPKGSSHRIQNPGNDLLVFIEIQTGEYFGEDDIVRIEDDFGRKD
ncbi:MAG: phosphomannose isomerase type II C-terminal cupin domain [Candidatus Anammoxibacter sp.]